MEPVSLEQYLESAPGRSFGAGLESAIDGGKRSSQAEVVLDRLPAELDLGRAPAKMQEALASPRAARPKQFRKPPRRRRVEGKDMNETLEERAVGPEAGL